MSKSKKEETASVWAKIVEQIGPLALMVLGLTFILDLLRRPLDVSSGISVVVVFVFVIMAFLLQRQRMEHSRKAREHASWVEGTRSLTEISASRGAERLTILKTYDSIIRLFERDSEDQQLTGRERAFYAQIVKRLKDMRDANLV